MWLVHFAIGIITGYFMWGLPLKKLHKGIRVLDATIKQVRSELNQQPSPPTYEARDDD